METPAVTLSGPGYAAPAKLNLFLHVVGRRADGYHLLQTAFVFLDSADTLRFRVRDDGVIARVSDLPGVAPADDLVVRAATLLQQAAGCRLGADIEVEKRLPMGGGLGGGSSDAATTLIVLNSLWRTGLDRAALQCLALQLGADVPVFVFGQTAIAGGVGELLDGIEFPEHFYVVLVPPVSVATTTVFSHPNLTRNTIPRKIADFSTGALEPLLAHLKNDLEPVVAAAHPEVASHLEMLRTACDESFFARGGRNARMTGSGACVFATFASEGEAREALQGLPGSVRGFVARGVSRHPLFALSR